MKGNGLTRRKGWIGEEERYWRDGEEDRGRGGLRERGGRRGEGGVDGGGIEGDMMEAGKEKG